MRFSLLVAVFTVAALATMVALVLAWAGLVLATGGELTECDRGDCGPLAEWAEDTWPLLPVLFVFAGLAAAWWLTRRLAQRLRR